ncbi:DUF4145 domain-containing protein, partial [Pseudomonas saliphila]|uniref:DUF4145 domain-containing protein n=1 Tax=Pseudomonas saliphila TaxID=2586906 RepID=UPI001238D3E0
MNKNNLISVFTNASVNKYSCPYCGNGELRLDGSINSRETIASQAEHDEEYWDLTFVRLVFSCSLKCSSCDELVFVVGDGWVEEEYYERPDGEVDRNYLEYYRPSYFHPALQLLDFPDACPEEVIAPLRTAFALYFSSPAVCCNSIRAAAEEILSALQVPLRRQSGNGYVPFAKRIEMLAEDKQSVRMLFDAVRWLGNHGSHSGAQVQSESHRVSW